jgi:hypothetical protein
MPPPTIDYRSPTTGSGQAKCLVCGSDKVVRGKLTGVNFRPDKLRKLFSFRSIVRVVGVDAFGCTVCGSVQMQTDAAALAKMAADP